MADRKIPTKLAQPSYKPRQAAFFRAIECLNLGLSNRIQQGWGSYVPVLRALQCAKNWWKRFCDKYRRLYILCLQKFSKISSVLTGNTCYKGCFHYYRHSISYRVHCFCFHKRSMSLYINSIIDVAVCVQEVARKCFVFFGLMHQAYLDIVRNMRSLQPNQRQNMAMQKQITPCDLDHTDPPEQMQGRPFFKHSDTGKPQPSYQLGKSEN